jgi:hypothetical protein
MPCICWFQTAEFPNKVVLLIYFTDLPPGTIYSLLFCYFDSQFLNRYNQLNHEKTSSNLPAFVVNV